MKLTQVLEELALDDSKRYVADGENETVGPFHLIALVKKREVFLYMDCKKGFFKTILHLDFMDLDWEVWSKEDEAKKQGGEAK